MRSVATLIGIALAAGALLGFTVPAGHTYVNHDYRYQVDLPAGIAAASNDAPSPNHGFVAVSPKLGRALVWVDASYDALLLGNLDAVVEHHTQAQVAVPQISASTLGGLPARVLVFTTEAGIEQLALSLRAQSDVGIIYTVGVRCTNESCAFARALAEDLRRSFALTGGS